MDATLALEDGVVLHGAGFGAETTVVAEVVFNTSLTGYQEVLTDPSYHGQMTAMTAAHIGNVGVNPADVESARPWVQGFIVREVSPCASNWRATETLPAYLTRHGIPGISEVDVRALTRHLRTRGVMKGALSTDGTSAARLVELARSWPGLDGRDLVREVTCPALHAWEEASDPAWEAAPGHAPASDAPLIVVYDFGVKWNILRRLTRFGCRVVTAPAATPAEEVLALAPDGILLSNGPGDPAALTYAVEATRRLLAAAAPRRNTACIPLFGICLGHQILGLALGGHTYKLKFGHHGGNQPVKDLMSGRVQITSQNHNYAVEAASLPPQVAVTHWNLNDGTVEGMRLKDRPVFSVQYHPEASPGPHDADGLFLRFLDAVRHPSAS